MKKVMLALMCMCLVSMSQALSITNGDFEIGGGENILDVSGWYDRNVGGFWEGAWQTNASWITTNGTNQVVLSGMGYGYLYQSIGLSAGEASIRVKFDWGQPNDTGAGRIDTVVVSLYAGNGVFVGGDNVDIRAAGLTLLDTASYTTPASPGGGVMFTDIATLNVGVSAGTELFLMFDSGAEWPVIDNIQIVPEPATMVLVGLGALLLRKRQA
jgi:hypothetical protein